MIRTFRRFSTPVGPVAYALDETGALTHLTLGSDSVPLEVQLDDEGYIAVPANDRCEEVEEQIRQFLTGERTCFEMLTSARGTPFQRRVWEALCSIEFGKTASAAEFAHMIGHPGAVRAVNAARMANPIRMIIPCHRVIDDTQPEMPEFQRRLLEFERGSRLITQFPEATGSIEQDRALGYLL